MDRMEVLLWAVLVLNVLGFGGLIVWLKRRIKALEGAVKAQGVTIDAQKTHLEAADQTIRRLQALMELLDLEQWAKRFQSHSKIVETEAEAKLEADRRRLQREIDEVQAKGKQTAETLAGLSSSYLRLSLTSLVYVPRGDRAALIDRTNLPGPLKDLLKEWAAEAPEQKESALMLLAKLALESESSPVDKAKGGFDVKPPPLKEPQ